MPIFAVYDASLREIVNKSFSVTDTANAASNRVYSDVNVGNCHGKSRCLAREAFDIARSGIMQKKLFNFM